jgi:hypothetical protein
MKPLENHHHFKAELIEPSDRVARCERHVVDLLLNTSIPDSQRDSSIAWELKHQAGVAQMARMLAGKRHLPMDVCTVGGLLHDIYVIVEGRYESHARLGVPIATRILAEVGGFSQEEVGQVCRIIENHSDKHVWSPDPFDELGKDADILDCFLYPGAIGEYLLQKPLWQVVHYLRRAQLVWEELSLGRDPRLALLDNYGDEWLRPLTSLPPSLAKRFLNVFLDVADRYATSLTAPTLACMVEPRAGGDLISWKEAPVVALYANPEDWVQFGASLKEVLAIQPSERAREFLSLVERFGVATADDADARTLLRKGPFSSREDRRRQVDELVDVVVDDHAVVVFWVPLGLYEIIQSGSNAQRIEALGLHSALA